MALLIIATGTNATPPPEGASATALFERAGPSVVGVAVFGTRSSGFGAGTLVSPQGHIVTCAHLVQPGKERPDHVYVFFMPRKLTHSFEDDLRGAVEARVVAVDHARHIALLRVERAKGGTSLPLAQVQPAGHSVLAVGHPEDQGVWSATLRTTTARDGALTLSKPVDIGFGGGPLITSKGTLAGLITLGTKRARSTVRTAVPVDHVRAVLRQHDVLERPAAPAAVGPDGLPVVDLTEPALQDISATRRPRLRDDLQRPIRRFQRARLLDAVKGRAGGLSPRKRR